MSNSVYPTLPGIGWGVVRTPVFSNAVKTTDSGREFARQAYSTPRYRYSLTYEFLRQADYETLKGFFAQMRGNLDTFLFEDPADKTVVDEPFGAADGVTTVFQLVRAKGGFTDPVYEPHGTLTIKKSGVTQSGYTLGSNGQITFAVAPSAGSLTWSGSYYWRCRFTNPTLEFEQFSGIHWTVRRVEFITVKP